MKYRAVSLCWLAIAALGPACDGDDTSGSPDAGNDTAADVVPDEGAEDSGPPDEPDGPPDYPPAPYGVVPTTRIENLQFLGTDGSRVQLSDFYMDRSVKLLWIYATAGWCPSCTEESRAMPAIYAEHHPNGLAILAVVFEDASHNPATVSYAAGYASRYGFTFPTVADQPFVTGRYFDRAATPMNMMVDLTDMEILSITMGWDPSRIPNDIEVKLLEIPDRE